MRVHADCGGGTGAGSRVPPQSEFLAGHGAPGAWRFKPAEALNPAPPTITTGGGSSFGGRGGGFGGRSGGFGGRGRGGYEQQGPPASVIEAGTFEHPCEGEAVIKLADSKQVRGGLTVDLGQGSQGVMMALWETARYKSCHVLSSNPLQIPYFNAPIFLENKTQVGKVEEIFGQINNVVSRGARPRDHSMWLLNVYFAAPYMRPCAFPYCVCILLKIGEWLSLSCLRCRRLCPSRASVWAWRCTWDFLVNPHSRALQFFTVKMSDGVVATSYNKGDKFFIDPAKLLPQERWVA